MRSAPVALRTEGQNANAPERNGRIPKYYGAKTLAFHNSFLYATSRTSWAKTIFLCACLFSIFALSPVRRSSQL
jgi:hypothetical protein